MPRRYVRPTIPGWLVPTIVGPLVSVYATVSLVALLWGDLGTIWRGLGWVAGMICGTLWGVAYVLLLALLDVSLLVIKLRTLPSGRRAWLVALATPPLILGIYHVFPPYKFYASGPWGVIAAILIPMVVVPLVTRVVFGTKPPR